MRFQVTSGGENYGVGALFYSVPSKKEIDKANVTIKKLCREKVGELYGGQNFMVARLEDELFLMEKTGAGFDFLLLKEIADFSREQGYPVLLMGDISGSVILYLLGVSLINPMPPHYRCEGECYPNFEVVEKAISGFDLPDRCCHICGKQMVKDGHDIRLDMVWKGDTQPQGLDIAIAETIRPYLPEYLDEKFGNCEADKMLYRRISMPSNSQCQLVGELNKKTKTKWSLEIFQDEALLQHVLKEFIKDEERHLEEMKAHHPETATWCEQELAFIKSCETITKVDFRTLTRIYGYRVMGTEEQKVKENVYDEHFVIFKDEQLNSKSTYGVWSKATCISRLMLMCLKKWYELNSKA